MTKNTHQKASRHQGIKASRGLGLEASTLTIQPGHAFRLVSSRRSQTLRSLYHRAFSLIEVLMSVIILGVGIISIAALFPAGIAQQRLSSDEVMGPIVAETALNVIRSKVRPDDFGNFEQFGIATVNTPRPTISGDWCWLRPAVLLKDDAVTQTTPPPGMGSQQPLDDRGSLDIFSNYHANSSSIHSATEFFANTGYPGSTPELHGIPYSQFKYGNAPPLIVIQQNERFYPQVPKAFMPQSSFESSRPQFVWECMFRRFEGRILVAIFVYRVTLPGGQSAGAYTTPGDNTTNVPPLPVWLNLVVDPGGSAPPFYSAGGAWDVFGPDGIAANEDDAIVLGTQGGTPYNSDDERQAWQEPRQWLIDQNNNAHRVLGQSRETSGDDVRIELVRAVPAMSLLSTFYLNTTLPINQRSTVDVVSDIWYMPSRSTIDLNNDGTRETDVTLTPVYATVKEL